MLKSLFIDSLLNGHQSEIEKAKTYEERIENAARSEFQIKMTYPKLKALYK